MPCLDREGVVGREVSNTASSSQPEHLNHQIKKSLRHSYRHLRRSLSPSYRSYSASLLSTQCASLKAIRQASRIAFYMASDGEIDPMGLVIWSWKMGKKCYLPVIQPDKTLLFARYDTQSKLCEGEFGILVPEEPSELLRADELDVICLPLVAFDRSKLRLGMGGGFYDRTLSSMNDLNLRQSTRLLGLAFDCQLCDSLPSEPWDQALHAVVTPSRLWS